MLLSLRKNGLTSLFKEVRAFKVIPVPEFCGFLKLQGVCVCVCVCVCVFAQQPPPRWDTASLWMSCCSRHAPRSTSVRLPALKLIPQHVLPASAGAYHSNREMF